MFEFRCGSHASSPSGVDPFGMDARGSGRFEGAVVTSRCRSVGSGY
ncbi:hypothetical protein OCGS_1360 [Oceaniovalibus guishaninsula JLT2003]|uniref:Uncharacterized protein n=1 Tax=Oceaniovalibus guishaninsula JLT2003 TaxID=1231392 RepID=K2HD76_9RHOB|nr:hypothetical protein OCGS_1360 [Oceaniovalibus guishaninsula JLT2003]